MRVGIYDIDTKKEKMGHGATEKFPNLACGKLYGYHKLNGDEVVYPWRGQPVDRLYVSAIFSWTRPSIERHMPAWERVAGEIIIGGTGWDWRTKLPPEVEAIDPRWTYDLYGIDYGIGFSVRGCHVGCSFCVVPRKEGITYTRVSGIAELINPRSNHLVLLNNNSLAEGDGFFSDAAEIRDRGLTVNYNQANDITQVEWEHATALAGLDYRNFNRTAKCLHFAMDQMRKNKRDPKSGQPLRNEQGEMVYYDMMQVVPEKARLLREAGIPQSHLHFLMLIGFDTTLEEDLARFRLLQGMGCEVFAMVFRDLTGKLDVDGRGKPQGAWVKPLRDWINGHAFRNVKFEEFDRYVRRTNDPQSRLVL